MKFSLFNLFSKKNKNSVNKKDELIKLVTDDLIKNGVPDNEIEFFERLSQFLTQDQLDNIFDDLPNAFNNAIIRDWLDNGIPTSEYDWVPNGIIYLYFNGIMFESLETIDKLRHEIACGALKKSVISKIVELKPYLVHELIVDEDTDKYTLNDLIPYYILQKKYGDLTPQKIEHARNWIKINIYKQEVIEQGGHWLWSVWLNGETPPHLKAEWKTRIEESRSTYWENERGQKDPIYGGRPKEILLAPRQELQDSFSWWSLELSLLLDPKRRAPEFFNDKSYDEVGFELGKRCLLLLPKAKDSLQPGDGRYSFEENNGLVRYVKLLIDYGKLEDALHVCEECIKYGVHDGTKTGFAGRAEKIKNKISKLSPKPENRGRKGKLTDEQILELVAKYLSSNSQERKELPAEYGITYSNMSYLVSKNKHRL